MTGTAPPGITTLRVRRRTAASEDVVALTLEHPRGEQLPDWTPGAHIDLVLPGGVTRQYSLCGNRWDVRSYRIGVLRTTAGRGGSALVHDALHEGVSVGVGGPRNHFRFVPSPRYVFVAGGIGITPILPMLRQAEMIGADWHLLYGGRSRRSMAFLPELEQHGDRVTVVPQDEQGLPDLAAWLPRARSDTKVYCCGPEPLIAAVERLCAGWPDGLLRTERFTARDTGGPTGDDRAFTVELARSGRAVTVEPGTSVLDAVNAAGVTVLSSCRQGTCGTCETTVLAGEPDHRDAILTDHDRAGGDSMFPCVSRARGDRLVLDL